MSLICTDGFGPCFCRACSAEAEVEELRVKAARIDELEGLLTKETETNEELLEANRRLREIVCADPECHTDFIEVYKEMVARGDRIKELESALRLISAIPAFPSKDIADKALGPVESWEPKAVKEWKERKGS